MATKARIKYIECCVPDVFEKGKLFSFADEVMPLRHPVNERYKVAFYLYGYLCEAVWLKDEHEMTIKVYSYPHSRFDADEFLENFKTQCRLCFLDENIKIGEEHYENCCGQLEFDIHFYYEDQPQV